MKSNIRNPNNSIFSPKYSLIKEYLDNKSKVKILTVNSLVICALFVAIKRKKYREKSLITLNELIKINTIEIMTEVLNNTETKSYDITSLDIFYKTRKEIISYMFTKLNDQNFYYGIIFTMGFYLTPEVLNLLKQYTQNNNPLIKREAFYAIDFIERKQKNS